jgi:hypothetical protein
MPEAIAATGSQTVSPHRVLRADHRVLRGKERSQGNKHDDVDMS